ncbi:MAG: Maf family protein [Actinomycetota bacterium]|nr:Maf family protein [Actinomycetota bacterium]
MGRRTLILASRSPQRRAILGQLGVRFSVRVPEVEELAELEGWPPEEVAAENAYRKAAAVASNLVDTPVLGADADTPVLGADTIVSAGARSFGKPAGEAQARACLRALAGRRHTVLSAVCLIEDGSARTVLSRTLVDFRALPEPLLEWYLRSGEWRERAGGYAIQGRGAALVAGIEGDYTGVVGLPVATLLELAPWLLI